MISERTALSSWVQSIVLALELEGPDGHQLFVEPGLDYQTPQDSNTRSPRDAMSRLWLCTVVLSNNPAIALSITRVRRPTFHVVGCALVSSRNLAEDFVRLGRYQRIIAKTSDLTFRRTPRGYRLGVTVHSDHLLAPPQNAECLLAYLVDMVRWITGQPLDPPAMKLPGMFHKPLAPYAELFRTSLRFHAEEFTLVLSRADLEIPLPSANEVLAQLHGHFAGEYLAHFNTSHIAYLARQTLCRLSPQGKPKCEQVAQALHLPQRTLQRRLQEEGTSYQQLLNDTRRDMADQYFQQPGLTLLEVAHLLGFADPGNLFRAFHRWFGRTLNEYRTHRQERPDQSPGQAVRFRTARRVTPRPGAGSSRGPGPTACRRPCRRC